MAIYTKSILKPICSEDGVRISVMSRHTLNDGTTPDERITSNSYNKWGKEFAPPDKLIRDYYRKENDEKKISWNEFEQQYISHIRKPEIADKVKSLAQRGLEETITLLCIEDKPDNCHRRLLAEECQRYKPQLIIEHK